MHVVFNVEKISLYIHYTYNKFKVFLPSWYIIMSMRLVKWNDKHAYGYSYVNCKRDILLTSHIQALLLHLYTVFLILNVQYICVYQI